MKDPKIAGRGPQQIKLEPKTHYWCACGHSRNQPFCDGSHNDSGTGITPVKFEIESEKDVWLCMCKRTGNPPFCDGTHNKLEE